MENISTTDERHYTRKKLIEFIQKKDVQKYDVLNLNLFNWSIEIINGNIDEVWDSIRVYIPALLNFCGIPFKIFLP